MAPWPRKVLILYEGANQGGDFGGSFAAGFRSFGCDVEFLPRAASWHASYDLILAYGPFTKASSMLPAARQLLALSMEQRPVFVWWLTEGVPPLWMPRWVVAAASRARLALDRWNALAHGHRLRVLGELRWLYARGVLDVLAVTSESRATYLRRFGLRPIVVPLGYHPDYYGADLGLSRDVDVCFIGNLAAPRRRRLFARVSGELRARNIAITAQEQLYDAARTRFLNRCRIMLNIMRAPQDFVGQRFLLGAANKTLIVSEPLNDSQPFVAGRHLVVAPITQLADTIAHYLAHDDERQRITDEAHRFVTHELTIAQMVGRILEQARAVHAARNPELRRNA